MDITLNNTILLLTIILIPLVGLLMAITPYLMKKSECFAVTVPEVARHDPYLRGLKRRYAVLMMILTLVFSMLGIIFVLSGNSMGSLVVVIAGTLFICFAGYALMLYFRRKVRDYKTEQHWIAEQQESVAFVSGGDIPRAISLKWNLLYIPVLLLTLAIGFVGYDQMPDMIARQIGFDGQVTTWMEKSIFVIFLPVIIQGFMFAGFAFSHWTITHSKNALNPSAPATSALAYGLFARAQSLYLLATGLIICVLLIAMPLSFMGILPLAQAGSAVMIGTIIVVIGGIAISVVYGQGGSRVFQRMQESSTLLADDDRYWKLGIFYFNPEDPSLFLLERFGIGWTMNWARPAVWAIVLGGFILSVGFMVLITLMLT